MNSLTRPSRWTAARWIQRCERRERGAPGSGRWRVPFQTWLARLSSSSSKPKKKWSRGPLPSWRVASTRRPRWARVRLTQAATVRSARGAEAGIGALQPAAAGEVDGAGQAALDPVAVRDPARAAGSRCRGRTDRAPPGCPGPRRSASSRPGRCDPAPARPAPAAAIGAGSAEAKVAPRRGGRGGGPRGGGASAVAAAGRTGRAVPGAEVRGSARPCRRRDDEPAAASVRTARAALPRRRRASRPAGRERRRQAPGVAARGSRARPAPARAQPGAAGRRQAGGERAHPPQDAARAPRAAADRAAARGPARPRRLAAPGRPAPGARPIRRTARANDRRAVTRRLYSVVSGSDRVPAISAMATPVEVVQDHQRRAACRAARPAPTRTREPRPPRGQLLVGAAGRVGGLDQAGRDLAAGALAVVLRHPEGDAQHPGAQRPRRDRSRPSAATSPGTPPGPGPRRRSAAIPWRRRARWMASSSAAKAPHAGGKAGQAGHRRLGPRPDPRATRCSWASRGRPSERGLSSSSGGRAGTGGGRIRFV